MRPLSHVFCETPTYRNKGLMNKISFLLRKWAVILKMRYHKQKHNHFSTKIGSSDKIDLQYVECKNKVWMVARHILQ